MFRFLLISIILFCTELQAQMKPIVIETKNFSMVLTINNKQRLVQSYIGKKLAVADYDQMKGGQEAYIAAGMENQFEPAIRIVHTDGNPSLELRYISHTSTNNGDVQTTDILLKDPVYPVDVHLFYAAYKNEDVIKAWTEITHREKSPVLMTEYASSLLHFTKDEYWLTQFHGDWAREMNMVEEKLTNGIKSIESKLGTRTNFYQTQAFYLSIHRPATETDREVMAGTLAWTGN